MKTIRGWLPAVVLLASAGVGCGGSGSHTCTPDLAVNWAIVDSNSNTPASCSDVGATNIRVTIDGQSMDFACPATQSSGSIPAPLNASGQHSVTVALLDSGTPVGTDVSITVNVDCSGHSATPDLTLTASVGCTPDLTISWAIISAFDGSSLTCGQAGGSDTVNAQIDGGGLTVLTDFPGPCATNASTGSFVAQLPSAGTYNVSLQLKAGSQIQSETSVITQVVDCSGTSATPIADLNVNF
ncbi:MAG TPA: hypothetical protein VKQ32_01640 [Polyangia bacterium]|nr:hypothetical protein [Polyangia bacterium]